MSHSPTSLPMLSRSAADPEFQVKRGRIRQSIMGWTYAPMPVPELARLCREIGFAAMEGVDPSHYPMIRDLGMEIALVGSHGFSKGPLNPNHRDEVISRLRQGIETAERYGSKRVITFTGMREPGITDEAAMRNCVETWQSVMPLAEEKGVDLCLEHLNSRDLGHMTKGHPGYFGDDVDRCAELVRRVGSPRMKLLFDFYHVQVMHGDVVRRYRELQPIIGHLHVAGVPGRGELDDQQELNYPAILRAVAESGYEGFVAQEFLPTWPDRELALRHAVAVCDV
jgi:hydroxypyruvate isomerase